MKLLVLGGTRFVGRHITQLALDSGHEVTLFNRGQTNPELFPEAEKLRGDREQDLSALEDESWDAVIDTSGYHPYAVRASAQLLSGRVAHYIFVSTISVYADPAQPELTEEAQIESAAGLDLDAIEEINGDTYGPLKAACEISCRESFDGTVLVVRPGLIVGPHDPTERFTYWPRRMDRGGEVLAPGEPERRVQLIDARDLAAWLLDAAQAGLEGTFNATGPDRELTMRGLLEACAEAVEAEVEFTWVEEEFLLQAGVEPWTELPLWLPAAHGGLMRINIDRALEAGLELRPLIETARDTFDWDQARGPGLQRGPGLGPARELALLQAWKAQTA